MPASDFFWTARAHKGWTQRQLAERLGVSQPSIAAVESGAKDATVSRVEAVLREAQLRLIPVPSWAMTAVDTATLIRSDLAKNRETDAMRAMVQFADDLRAVDLATRVGLVLSPPPLIGEPRWDAFVAGVAEWGLDLDGLPHPTWLADEHRSLDAAWDIEPIPSLQADGRAHTPPALARHGVYLHDSFFASV